MEKDERARLQALEELEAEILEQDQRDLIEGNMDEDILMENEYTVEEDNILSLPVLPSGIFKFQFCYLR